ncbi:hypothetical protein Lser_V15G36557 [Lactuca serriola]
MANVDSRVYEIIRVSMLVNGTPTKEFAVEKRVRQADPCSPFLFVIDMEGLNVSLKPACSKGIFREVQLPNNGPIISHILYADDALFLGEWSKGNIKNLARILRFFHVSYGKVNFNTSRVFGVGTTLEETSRWARSLL